MMDDFYCDSDCSNCERSFYCHHERNKYEGLFIPVDDESCEELEND